MKIAKTLSFLLVLGLASCTKEEGPSPAPADPLKNYTLWGSASNDNLEIEAYGTREAFVGYNEVHLRVKSKTGGELNNATVQFMPMMDMGTMMHSTPAHQPAFNSELSAYSGAVSFIMPSTNGGEWMFNAIVEHNGVKDTLGFTFEVVAASPTRMYNFISAIDSSTAYFVAYKEPAAPKVGMNDMELMIYKRENMMSFPAVADLQIEIEPEMPSMGHGSPDNVNPVYVEDGLYRGKVNFTMGGIWKINVMVKNANGDTLHSQGAFEVEVF